MFGVKLFMLALLVASLGTLLIAPAASAQPSDLLACVSVDLPTCYDPLGGIVFSRICLGRQFNIFLGQFAWHPLRNVGPIEIEIETLSSLHQQFPLHVEIVPLDGIDPTTVCQNAPGRVLMTINPRTSRRPDPCNYWESSGIVDISHVVPIGHAYGVRVYSFYHPGLITSPGVDCIRITSHPVSSPLASSSWGGVKRLYR